MLFISGEGGQQRSRGEILLTEDDATVKKMGRRKGE
jgi:hypothetical protein